MWLTSNIICGPEHDSPLPVECRPSLLSAQSTSAAHFTVAAHEPTYNYLSPYRGSVDRHRLIST